MTMTAETIVAICQSGGEFVTKDDGTTQYNGGEAHALTITRDMPFNDLKSEISNMFSADISTMSIKYFLPINKRTPITISNDKDLERMFDFHANSLTIDIYLTNKNDNRTNRSIAADSGTSMVETAADRSLRSKRPTAAKNKRAMSGRVSIVDSTIPKVVTGAVTDYIKTRKQKANERAVISCGISTRIAAEDSALPVSSTPTIDINRQEIIESDAFDKVDVNSDFMNTFNDPIPLNSHYIGPWNNITMEVGQEFDNVRALRDDLCKYAFAKGFRYRFIKNEHTRITAKCSSDSCPWRIHASRPARKQSIMIKKMNNMHTCGEHENSLPRTRKYWLANIIRGKVLEYPDVRPRDIARDLYQDYGISLSYCQVWHAKETAKKEIHMLQEEACNQLPWLCEQIMSTNPGSVAMLTTSLDSLIRRCFLSFYSSLHGFEKGCRPLVFLDRMCLKINHHWKVLVAASVDGNNEIYPIAFAVVENETPETWHWFLVQLKYAMPGYHKITIVSSRRNGLDESVPKVFTESHHGYSLSHLIEELKAELKKGSLSEKAKEEIIESFCGAASAYLVEDFNSCMDKIDKISKDVAEWIMSTKPEHWSNALFTGAFYELHSSDIVEPLNKWTSMKDESSAVEILHALLVKTTEIISLRRQISNTWEGTLTPYSEKKLQKDISKARAYNVVCSSESMFEVRCTTVNVVNIADWECSCKKWQITGLPCMHAAAVFDRVEKDVYDFCSKFFKKESYIATYSEPIHRIPDISEMKYFVPASSYPPPTNRPPGQPKRKRINPNKTVIRPLHCSRCKVVGHNKATCDSQL